MASLTTPAARQQARGDGSDWATTMFAFFESRIRPTALPEAPPPGGLLAFYWHFVRQTRGLYAAMFATGLAVALIDTAIPVFIGKLVTLMEADRPRRGLQRRAADARSAWPPSY